MRDDRASSKPWQWVIAIVIGLAGMGLAVGLGFFLVLMSAFAYDSPQRSTESADLVMILLVAGALLSGLAGWPLGLAIPLSGPRRILALIGGLMLGLGILFDCGGVGVALGGLEW